MKVEPRRTLVMVACRLAHRYSPYLSINLVVSLFFVRPLYCEVSVPCPTPYPLSHVFISKYEYAVVCPSSSFSMLSRTASFSITHLQFRISQLFNAPLLHLLSPMMFQGIYLFLCETICIHIPSSLLNLSDQQKNPKFKATKATSLW